MRFKVIILIALFSTAALLWSDTVLEYFTAKSSGNSIAVEWKSSDETSIVRYELERGTSGQYFQKIESFDTKGQGSVYRHIDDNAFLRDNADKDKAMQKTTFQYRLKIIKPQNTYTYSNTVNVVHDINVIRRTWGMIKEMFR